jgi:hypothetical protein
MIFKHFSHWDPASIDSSTTYNTDNWQSSSYWLNKQVDEVQIQGTVEPLIEGISKILRLFGQTLDISPLSSEIQKAKYYSELLKEYIFEDIRINEFPSKPSRKKCMFLAPSEVDIYEYAKRLGYQVEKKNFFEIETTEASNIHYADLCNTPLI